MEMDGVVVGVDLATTHDFSAIVTSTIDARVAAGTMPDIILTGEIKLPSQVKAMNNFLKPLCPPAPKKSPRQRRSEARRARQMARPPAKGYWAKKRRPKVTVKFETVKVEPNGDLIVRRPYNQRDFRSSPEVVEAAFKVVRPARGGLDHPLYTITEQTS